jgi:hypothetical protein
LVTIAVTCALSAAPLPVTAALTSAHHRRHVQPGEHPLDGQHVGMMGVQPVLDDIAEGKQPLGNRRVRRRAHHVDIQRDDLPPTPAFDNRQPAPGQPGIDAHHAHRTLPTSTEQLFDSLVGGTDSGR